MISSWLGIGSPGFGARGNVSTVMSLVSVSGAGAVDRLTSPASAVLSTNSAPRPRPALFARWGVIRAFSTSHSPHIGQVTWPSSRKASKVALSLNQESKWCSLAQRRAYLITVVSFVSFVSFGRCQATAALRRQLLSDTRVLNILC